MVGAQLDATFKECLWVGVCENGFLHVVVSSLEDLLNNFHFFFFKLSNWAKVCTISLL